MQRLEVVLEVVHPHRVVDAAVDGVGRIVPGRAVLGDHQGQAVGLFVQPDQGVGQGGRIDLPTGLGVGVLDLLHRTRADGPRVGRVFRHGARVPVQPHPVGGLSDQVEVFLRELAVRLAIDILQLFRIAAAHQRIEEPAVHLGLGAFARGLVLRPVRGGVFGLDVEDDADLALAHFPEAFHRRAVCAQDVVAGDHGLEGRAVAGGEGAVQITAVDDHPGLVDRAPGLHPALEFLEQDLAVVGEPVGDVGVEPAAPIVQRGGQVPVIQRAQRLDPGLEQAIDQAVVEGEALVVDGAPALGHDPAPADRESVGLEVEPLHQLDVLTPAIVVVAGHVAGVAVAHIARRVAEPVPDRGSRAIRHRRALDLIGRCRRTPQETFWKQIVAGVSGGHVSGS